MCRNWKFKKSYSVSKKNTKNDYSLSKKYSKKKNLCLIITFSYVDASKRNIHGMHMHNLRRLWRHGFARWCVIVASAHKSVVSFALHYDLQGNTHASRPTRASFTHVHRTRAYTIHVTAVLLILNHPARP